MATYNNPAMMSQMRAGALRRMMPNYGAPKPMMTGGGMPPSTMPPSGGSGPGMQVGGSPGPMQTGGGMSPMQAGGFPMQTGGGMPPMQAGGGPPPMQPGGIPKIGTNMQTGGGLPPSTMPPPPGGRLLQQSYGQNPTARGPLPQSTLPQWQPQQFPGNPNAMKPPQIGGPTGIPPGYQNGGYVPFPNGMPGNPGTPLNPLQLAQGIKPGGTPAAGGGAAAPPGSFDWQRNRNTNPTLRG